MSYINVLFVDDEQDIAEGLADYLNRIDGFHALAKHSGKEALKEIEINIKEGRPYDVVICDLLMPELDGIDVLKEALFLDPYICFIILTGYGTIETAVQSMEMGAYNYIEKPLDGSIEDKISLIKRGVADKKITKIRHAVLKTHDEKIIIELISNAMETLFLPREFFLAVIKRDKDDFEIIKKKGDFEEQDLNKRGFIKEILKTKKRIVELDLDEDRKSLLNPLSKDSKSLLVEPLIVHNELLGILELGSNKKNAFTFFDQRTIAEFADTAALALNNSKILKEQRENLERQQELILNINHLIKNPLWNIIGRVESIMNRYKEELPEGVEVYLDGIWENGKRAEKLVRETLTGHKDNVKEVEIGQVIDYIKSDYKEEGITTAIDWPDDMEFLKVKIRCKPRQIEMALRNVIDNAMDAINELGAKGIIKVKGEIRDSGRKLYITIKDSGKGIRAEIRDKLFNTPFITSKEDSGGTGLGLYMCGKNIREHNGRIDIVDSSINGTTFSISLPLNQ